MTVHELTAHEFFALCYNDFSRTAADPRTIRGGSAEVSQRFAESSYILSMHIFQPEQPTRGARGGFAEVSRRLKASFLT